VSDWGKKTRVAAHPYLVYCAGCDAFRRVTNAVCVADHRNLPACRNVLNCADCRPVQAATAEEAR